jgi:hypothetical protein
VSDNINLNHNIVARYISKTSHSNCCSPSTSLDLLALNKSAEFQSSAIFKTMTPILFHVSSISTLSTFLMIKKRLDQRSSYTQKIKITFTDLSQRTASVSSRPPLVDRVILASKLLIFQAGGPFRVGFESTILHCSRTKGLFTSKTPPILVFRSTENMSGNKLMNSLLSSPRINSGANDSLPLRMS